MMTTRTESSTEDKMTKTEISEETIEQLKSEAGAAGDLEMVRICDQALNEDEAAAEECARVIAQARAMED